MAKIQSNKKSAFDATKIDFIQLFVRKSNIEFDSSLTNDDITGYEMKLGKDIKYSFGDKMCRVILDFEFDSSSSNDKKAKAIFSIEIHFKIDNMEELCEQSDTGVKIDLTLPAHLVGMAYSTSRGIIYERLLSTPFRGLLLPVIDPYKEMED